MKISEEQKDYLIVLRKNKKKTSNFKQNQACAFAQFQNMHPVPTNWFDRINLAKNSTSSLISLKSTLNSTRKRRKCFLDCQSILFTIIVLNIYFLQLSLVVGDTAGRSASGSISKSPIIVHLSEQSKKGQIDSLSIHENQQEQRTNNLIRNNSIHLKNQLYRTIRSIKLANHRLKHRRSSNNLEKTYQSSSISTSNHLAKTNYWSVLGDQEAEYALKVLESEHLTAAILHFIEITYKYADSNLPTLQEQNELSDTNATITSLDGKKSFNKYYNTGSCVQVKLDSLRSFLKSKSFAKYSKQAETAKRTASLLTTLLSERLELTTDRSYIKNHFFSLNDTSNIVLHKAFFWSLLKVNLQSDPNLFANGIIFRPDLNQFPIKLFSNSIQSNDENNEEPNNSTNNKPFCPYIFRKKTNSFKAKLAKSHLNSSQTNRSSYNYINLSGINSFTPRIIPNPNLRFSVDDVRDSMKNKTANLAQLKQTLYNKKHLDPYLNTYSYSSDWYQHYADKYLNNSQQFNYHELIKYHYLNDSRDPGYWTVPYSDCSATGTWLISYSVPFFGLSKSTNQIEFK